MAQVLGFWMKTREKGHVNEEKNFEKNLRKRQKKIEMQKLFDGW